MRVAADGRTYYLDHNTRSTTWHRPGHARDDLGPLPAGWEMRKSNDGRVFFIDHSELVALVAFSVTLVPRPLPLPLQLHAQPRGKIHDSQPKAKTDQ